MLPSPSRRRRRVGLCQGPAAKPEQIKTPWRLSNQSVTPDDWRDATSFFLRDGSGIFAPDPATSVRPPARTAPWRTRLPWMLPPFRTDPDRCRPPTISLACAGHTKFPLRRTYLECRAVSFSTRPGRFPGRADQPSSFSRIRLSERMLRAVPRQPRRLAMKGLVSLLLPTPSTKSMYSAREPDASISLPRPA